MITEHDLEWTDEKVSRLWDYYARSGIAYFSELFGSQIIRRSGIPLKAAYRVLDFGSGPGFMWKHLQRLGSNWTYTGVDFSPDSAAKVNKAGLGHPNFEQALHLESLPTPLEAESFDVIMLLEVIEHLNDDYLSGTLNECRRLLKPEGRLIVSTPNAEDLSKAIKFCPECGAKFHEFQHVRSWTTASITRHLAPYGFLPERVQTLNFAMLSPFRRGFNMLRRTLNPAADRPHMLAVFRKSG